MSKDIRSFFKLQSGSKARIKPPEPANKKPAKIISSDDDDIIPNSPQVTVKSKDNKISKKRRIMDDSSDEEKFDKKSKETNKKSSKNDLKKPNKSPLKQVSAADMFGIAPVKRTPLPTKTEPENKPNIETEITIHDDEDFEKTLLQVDVPINTPCDENQEAEGNAKVNAEDVKTEKTTEESPKETSKYFNEEVHKNGTIEKQKDETSEKQNDNSNKNFNGSALSSYKIPKKARTEKPEKTLPNKALNREKQDNKRDYSEFLEIGSQNESQGDDTPTSKSKKRKCDQSLNESVISDEERFEKRRHSAQLYKSYLSRTGPKNLGAKEIPEGAPNCLKNLSFVLTGVLNSFEREEIVAAIQKYGGTVKSGVSKKVTHVLAGEDAGPAKLAKAEEIGLTILGEDGFLELILKQSDPSTKEPSENKKNLKDVKKAKSENKIENRKTNEHKKEIKEEKSQENKMENSEKTDAKEVNKEKTQVKEIKAASFYKNKDFEPSTSKEKDQPMEVDRLSNKEDKSSSSTMSIGSVSSIDAATLMWVDKYKPKTVKQIIGQNGDASIVKKLTTWLTRWYINRKEKLTKPSPWAKNDDGGYYKTALLSGPPGIGKTTTVSLVCAELGFDMVEFNASDTRSKSLIKDQISELLTTNSLAGFVNGQNGMKAISKKHVLVMDEVDGMAGNEDRGGMQELISLIKLTSVPIICMCNDRNSTKIRSLANYCYDLRFNRPRVDQIKSAMMSVCFKEGVKIAPDVLTQLIVSANQDVRQTLNLLSMYAVQGTTDGGPVTIKKDVKLGPWEVVRKVFSEEEQKKMSLYDKSDLFFYDYSIAPLFVQENYLQVQPHCPRNEVLKRVSRAAESISLGDLVESKIRRSAAWSLLPVQAMYSSVIPGHHMCGHVAGQIQFPSWLGKNSRAGKMQRLAQQIHAHTRLSASGSKSAIFLDYCQQLRDAIVQPLVRDKSDGIPRSLEVLQAYHLLREDLDSLTELSMWPGQRDPMVLVESKVKAAMTRAYNKEAATLPYTQAAVRKARAAAAEQEVLPGEEGVGEEEEEEEEQEDSDPESDAMIKKKKKEKKPAQSSEAGTSEPKGKVKKGKNKN